MADMGDKKVILRRKQIDGPIEGNFSHPTLRIKSGHERRPRSERSGSFAAFEELVQCGICLEKLTEPRMLPCQHTFCLACLQSHFTTSVTKNSLPGDEMVQTDINKVMECPTCQHIIKLEKGSDSLEELPKNLYINSLLNLMEESPAEIPQSPGKIEIRCIKCQIVCAFQEQRCKHCKQIFCKVCWSEHMSDLEQKLSALTKQLGDSITRLDYRVDEFQARCVQLNENIKKAADAKISEIESNQHLALKEVVKIKSQGDESSQNLKERILGIKSEIENINFHLVDNDDKKVEHFMSFHRTTTKILDEISLWGETRTIFDPDTFKVEQANEPNSSFDNEDSDCIDGSPTSTSENDESMADHYKSRSFVPKLVWTKCPRPAGVAVPPWAPKLVYIAATDSRMVVILNRERMKVVGKLTTAEMLCPHGIAFSKGRGEIYVSDKWRHCIHVFRSDGEYMRALCLKNKDKLRSPEGIAVGPNNEIIIADTGNDRVILAHPEDGRLLGLIGVVDKCTELNSPTGVAVAGDKIVVADTGNHRIKFFSFKGEKLMELGSLGKHRGQFRSAEVVATDPMGNLLVGDAGNGRVQIFKSDGSLIKIFGGFGETAGKFNWLSGITVTAQLEIITTDYKNRCLQIF